MQTSNVTMVVLSRPLIHIPGGALHFRLVVSAELAHIMTVMGHGGCRTLQKLLHQDPYMNDCLARCYTTTSVSMHDHIDLQVNLPCTSLMDVLPTTVRKGSPFICQSGSRLLQVTWVHMHHIFTFRRLALR